MADEGRSLAFNFILEFKIHVIKQKPRLPLVEEVLFFAETKAYNDYNIIIN